MMDVLIDNVAIYVVLYFKLDEVRTICRDSVPRLALAALPYSTLLRNYD